MRILGFRPAVLVMLLALLLLALAAPLFILEKFPTLEWAYVWAFAIAVLGLNLLTGYSGQISLGNGAFMAIGGYTTAILEWKLGWPFLATLPLAAILAGIGGFLFGIPALKLRGLYLALATFSLSLSAPTAIRHFGDLTGGHQGINLKAAHDPFGLVDSQQMTTEQWLYYIGLFLAILLFLFARAVLNSRTGRAFKAIRDSETAAVANGISLTYYKTLAFGISAFYAGVAGSLVATDTAYVGPDSFDVTLSLFLLVGAVVGGLGTLVGPVLGGVFITWAPIYTQQAKLPFSSVQLRPDIAYGAILILLMLLMPGGVVGGYYRAMAWIQARRRGRPQPIRDEMSPEAAVSGDDSELVPVTPAPIEAGPGPGSS